jgi:hypothetical protein
LPAAKTRTMMPISAAVVNPIVATIETSIHASMKVSVFKEERGREAVASWRRLLQLPTDHGFSDSVYARSCDQPLMDGVYVAT